MFFICFRLFTNGMKFGFVCLVFDCFLMESQVFRWLCVNFVDMWVLLGGTSVFLIVFERPVGALHAELAVEGGTGVLLSAAHVCVHHFSSCCVSLALNRRELLFLFFALLTLSLPVLAYCLAHWWPVLSL